MNSHRIYVYGIIVAVAFAVYGNTIPHDYALDDIGVISQNEFTKKGIGGIGEILSFDSLAGNQGKKSVVEGGRYRPLSLVTFAIEYEFLGLNPHFSHFINVLLYALTGVMIYIVLKKILSKSLPLCKGELEGVDNAAKRGLPHLTSPYPSTSLRACKGEEQLWYLSVPFLTAIFFIVHPIHTEVVANIKGRDEIMSFLGALITWVLILKYLDEKKRRYLILGIVTFFLALMSKENAITFVLVIPLSIYFFTGHKKIFAVTFSLMIPAAVFLMIRHAVIGSPPTELIRQELVVNPFRDASFAEKYATIFYTYGVYLKLLVFPHPLTIDYYPYHIPIVGLVNIRAIIPFVIYLGLFVYAVATFRKKSIISFGIWFYLITFSIVSNLFFSVGTFMNERFVYVSSLGFCLIISYLLAEKLPRYLRRERLALAISGVVVVIILSLFSFKAISRNSIWRDNFTLFSTDVLISSNSVFSNTWAGKEFYKQAKKEDNGAKKDEYFNSAIKYLSKAVEIAPDNAMALIFLGDVYRDKQDYEKAVPYYRKSLEISPGRADANARLGKLYGRNLNDVEKAIPYLQKAVEIDPTDADVFNDLGIAYGARRDSGSALKMFEMAVKLDPANKIYLKNLCMTYGQLGNTKKSQECLDKLGSAIEKE